MCLYDNLPLVRSPDALSGRVGKHSCLVQVLFLICPRFREEAYSLMSKSPFFGTWDPDVLRSYVDYALVEDSSGKVRLKCSNIQVRAKRHKHSLLKLGTQEAVVFADKTRSVEAWSVLPQIDKRIAMKWIMPSPEESILKSYELVQEGVWRRSENVTNTLIGSATHLVSLICRMLLSAPNSHADGPRQPEGSW